MDHKHQLIKAYKDLALIENCLPVSRKKVVRQAGLDIEEFIKQFDDLNELQRTIWAEYFLETMKILGASDEYPAYSSREKLLSFYFTFLEVLKPERSFILHYAPKLGVWNYNPDFLMSLKKMFVAYVNEILEEGTAEGEIEDRMIVPVDFPDWHWPQLLYLLNTWVDDTTEDQEKTDKAIEKAVNLGFDLMGRNVVDSALDFAKFLFAGK